MGAMPVECYKQMSAIKEGVIVRLQCIYIYNYIYVLGMTWNSSSEEVCQIQHLFPNLTWFGQEGHPTTKTCSNIPMDRQLPDGDY